MKRLRLGLAVGGMAVSAAVCVALWPHARDAGAILAAQNDPAELSDLQLNSALRNNRAIIETPASLWKCGTAWSDISFTLDGNDGRTQPMRQCETPRTILAGGVDS